MYQFYYADTERALPEAEFKDDVKNHININAIRPTMWEEHCLECSAPLCFESCLYYSARSDGRCMRFDNGISVHDDARGCAGQRAHLKFRKWANMMTVIYPSGLAPKDYTALTQKNQKRGKQLKKLADSSLPRKLRWEGIRTFEWLRRRKLRSVKAEEFIPDAFVFHGYSHESADFKLMIEVFEGHTSLFRLSLSITSGENLHIIERASLSPDCFKAGNTVKVYPENDIEAELDILWCDFVQGDIIAKEEPAKTVKCVVWDLDNTLWDGVLIETDNPSELQLRPFALELIKALDERGIIQSIASKNDFEPAWREVTRLGIGEYFLYPQIHWNSKSGSIKQIAKSLNIGVDSLALIDDSVFEREQVKSVLPQVRVYDEAQLSEIISMPEFAVTVTEESRHRRMMYRAEEKRSAAAAEGNNDTVEFLRKCHLELDVFVPESESEIRRCYELVLRTNQLNMSGKKYTEDEFKAVLGLSEHKNFAFSCKDDFGEYGIVGFGQVKPCGDVLLFTEFAMSCRVAGKYVESALFAYLLKTFGAKKGSFNIVITKKNSLLRSSLAEIGFKTEEDSGKELKLSYSLPLKNDTVISVNGSRFEHIS